MMLAVLDPLLVGVITVTVGVVFTAIPASISAISSRKIHKTVGETNGTGSLSSMLQSIVQWQGEHSTLDSQEFADIQRKIDYIDTVLEERTHRFAEIDASIGALNEYSHTRWHDMDNWMTKHNLGYGVLQAMSEQLKGIRDKQNDIELKTDYIGGTIPKVLSGEPPQPQHLEPGENQGQEPPPPADHAPA